MALINRLTRLVKADFHAVLDNLEEPEQLLKQAIRDMEDELAETEQRVILCVKDQEALELRIAELRSSGTEICSSTSLHINPFDMILNQRRQSNNNQKSSNCSHFANKPRQIYCNSASRSFMLCWTRTCQEPPFFQV